MDKNQVLGFILIFVVVIGWSVWTTPSPEEIARQKAVQDSIALVEQQIAATDSIIRQASTQSQDAPVAIPDSIVDATQRARFGAFAPSAGAEQQDYTLSNSLATYTISSKGGWISDAAMKDHVVTVDPVTGEEIEARQLHFMTGEGNRFGLDLDVPGAYNGKVNTADLTFAGQQSGDKLTMTATAANGGTISYIYTLASDDYLLNMDIRFDNVGAVIDNKSAIPLTWTNNLEKLERNVTFEQRYSTVYFKEVDEDVDYCSCMSDDVEELDSKRIEWVSHSNQFFNTSIIPRVEPFASGLFETVVPEEEDAAVLKTLNTEVAIPYAGGQETFAMSVYAGPNDYTRLAAFDNDLQQIIPFGRSIFGTINRYVIRPVFDYLSGVISSKGIVIIVMILMLKILLYPFMYKMLFSQAKMSALKPELAHLKEKFKEEPQKLQMEQMKVYSSYGVSPLGGCLPMIMQMPIWYALFRFFPASITFRQESFLWATDLSSYDKFFELPFEVPLGFGSHISLFTLLWAVSMLAYTFYNTRHMDMAANPAMKYVQYLMPVMFVGFFNNYASGLTVYMLFSNLINIVQTVGTKKFVFNEEKILAELKEKKKNKPAKKGGGFGARLEKMMEEQKKIAAQQQAQRKKRK